jgi:hypothetical protein
MRPNMRPFTLRSIPRLSTTSCWYDSLPIVSPLPCPREINTNNLVTYHVRSRGTSVEALFFCHDVNGASNTQGSAASCGSSSHSRVYNMSWGDGTYLEETCLQCLGYLNSRHAP